MRRSRLRASRALLASIMLLPLATLVTAEVGAETGDRVVTLIHLNDLHAHLVPHLDLVRELSEDGAPGAVVASRGGLARIATAIRRIRVDNPDSLLMNVGDTYHGGVEALYTRGNALVAPVDALGIDVGVPGNWDFAYGPLVTRLRYAPGRSRLARFANWVTRGDPVESPSFPNLAANLRQTFPPVFGDPLLPGSLILESGGVRIGFIGITADIVERMAKPFAWGLEFLEGEQSYRDLIDDTAAQLRADGAEVVVVLSELGLHKDLRLADVVAPGIDVFFSAHTHELTLQPLASLSGAVVVESGNDGTLGRMDVTVRDGRVVDLRWRLLPIDGDLPEDPGMAELVATARAPFLDPQVHMEHPMRWIDLPLSEPIDTVIGHTDRLLHRRGALHNPINDMLAEVMRRLAGTQVSTTPGFRFDAIVPPRGFTGPGGSVSSGEITLEDLYRMLPVSPEVAIGEVTGRALREVVESDLSRVFSQDSFRHSGGWFGTLGGVELDLDLKRPDGQRVLEMRLAGGEDPIADDQVLTVVSCVRPFDDEGTMCSNRGYQQIEPFDNEATGNPWLPFQALRQALASGDAPAAGSAGVIDRAGLARWPASPFVQPLR